MRSYPSCWNSTLTRLGFKRKRRRPAKQPAWSYGRRNLFEPLEPREMLAGDTYQITTLEDVSFAGDPTDNQWSLREALVHSANNQLAGEVDTIDLSSFTGDINLALGQLTINSNVSITGPGADLLTINAHTNSRVLQVNSGVEATVSGLKITGGNLGGFNSGGGIQNQGDLTLDSVTITGNMAGYRGGGVYSTGTLEVHNSAIFGNTADAGGGISVRTTLANALTLTDSAITNNFANTDGGGTSGNGGGLELDGINQATTAATATITNTTISTNEAKGRGGGAHISRGFSATFINNTITENTATNLDGGGLRGHLPGSVLLHNTILAANVTLHMDHQGTRDTNISLHGDSSHNLIGQRGYSGLDNDPGDGSENYNQVGGYSSLPILVPELDPLGDYGGPTLTHRLKTDSPAIDAGDNGEVAGVSSDQRGDAYHRILNGTVDIGASEGHVVVDSQTGWVTVYGTALEDDIVLQASAVTVDTLGATPISADLQNATVVWAYGGDENDDISVASGLSRGVRLYGQLGNDKLTGSFHDDWLYGGDGRDTLDGGQGTDRLEGGDGNDIYKFRNGSPVSDLQTVIELAGGGVDTIDMSGFVDEGITLSLADASAQFPGDALQSYKLVGLGNQELEELIGTNYADQLTGNQWNNTITGGGGNDTLTGGAGDDMLYGGAGNDTLDGDSGTDRLEGGGGNDTYKFRNLSSAANDTQWVIEDSGGGNDTLDVSGYELGVVLDLTDTGPQNLIVDLANYALADLGNQELENVIGTSNGDQITGNERDNILTGGDGDDTLDGGAGNDTLEGGAGDDTYQIRFLDGHNLIDDSGGDADKLDFSLWDDVYGVTVDLGATTGHAQTTQDVGWTLLQNTIEDVIGSPLSDDLIGNNFNNVLIGGEGNDSLAGGGGDDTYVFAGSGQLGTDTVTEVQGEGEDTLDFSAADVSSGTGLVLDLGSTDSQVALAGGAGDMLSFTPLGGQEIERVFGTGQADIIAGNAEANALWGGAGNDLLFGRAGNDELFGQAGDDTLGGGLGTDTLDGGSGFDTPEFVDNQDASGFSSTGAFLPVASSGLNGQHLQAAAGSGSTATWSFTGLAAGYYTVYATWPDVSGLSASAPFGVSVDGGAATAVPVDQTALPAGDVVADAPWASLGTFNPAAGDVTVTLSDAADAAVAADAIRIVRTDDQGQPLDAPGEIKGTKFHDNFITNGVRDTGLVQGAEPDVVFVIDVSGSTVNNTFNGSSVGNVNNDLDDQQQPISDSILDAELAAFIALNQDLINRGLGSDASVSIVVFGTNAAAIDMDPTTSAFDSAIAANAEITLTGGVQVNAVNFLLQNAVRAGMRAVEMSPAVSVGGATNYQQGLQKAIDVLGGATNIDSNDNVIFLSDGVPTQPSSSASEFANQVADLQTGGANLRAFGAIAAGLGQSTINDIETLLETIDSNAILFNTTDEILDTFSGLEGGQQSFLEPALEDWLIYIDENDNGVRDGAEPFRVTDESGYYAFQTNAAGNYTLREQQQLGWYQSGPADGAPHTVSITDPAVDIVDPKDFGNIEAPYVSVSDAQSLEGDVSAVSRPFQVNLSESMATDVTVEFQITPVDAGSDAGGADYQVVSNQVTIPAGSTSFALPIDVLGDSIVEADEQFRVVLTGVEAADGTTPVTLGIGLEEAIVTIQNDDSAVVTISAGPDVAELDSTGGQGDPDPNSVVFTIQLSNPVDVTVAVQATSADGTATTADNDYTPVDLTAQFLPFDTQATTYTFGVAVTPDTIIEDDETFSVLLSNLQAGGRDVTLAVDPSATATILNDDLGIHLIEDDHFVEHYETTLDIAAGSAVTIEYSSLAFDTPSDISDVNDAFELVLLGPDGQPVVPTIGDGRTAFFNITESNDLTQSTYLASGVTHDPQNGVVTVDVSHLPPTLVGDPSDDLTLIARLVNNDDDDTTTVTLTEPTVAPAGSPPDPAVVPVTRSSNLIDQPFDPDELDDLTAYFNAEYTHTTYDEQEGALRAGLTLTSTSAEMIRGPLIAVVTNLRWQDPLITDPVDFLPIETDGVTSTGARYYDLTHQAFSPLDPALLSGESVEGRDLVFRVPTEQRFDFDLEIRGHLNDAPYFTNTPRFADEAAQRVDIGLGNTFRHDAEGVDPEGDATFFRLLDGPSGLAFVNESGPAESQDGELTWDTTGFSLGFTHDVTLEIVDEYGASTTQTFTLQVTSLNRAPFFVEPGPEVDAFSNQLYEYTPTAVDPDFDSPLYITLGPGTDPRLLLPDVDFAPATGRLSWTPSPDEVGQSYDVEFLVTDRLTNGLTGPPLAYTIEVHADPENQDPYFTSEPVETYTLPVQLTTGTSPNPVAPEFINTTLANLQQSIYNVSFNEAGSAAAADIVFVVDRSPSMIDGFDWLTSVIGQVESGLQAGGIGNPTAGSTNQYAVVTFHSTAENIPLGAAGDEFGTASEAITGINELIAGLHGGVGGSITENGKLGLETALDLLDELAQDGLAGAAQAIVLVTDADATPDSDGFGVTIDDFDGIRDRLTRDTTNTDDDIVFTAVVDALFSADDGADNSVGITEVVGSWSTDTDSFDATVDTSGTVAEAVALSSLSPGSFPWKLPDTRLIGEVMLEVQAEFAVVDTSPQGEGDAAVIFDYESPDDFKYIRLDIGLNKWVVGHRDSLGWQDDFVSRSDANIAVAQPVAVEIELDTFILSETETFTYIDFVANGVDFDIWDDATTGVAVLGSPSYTEAYLDGQIGLGATHSFAEFYSFSVAIGDHDAPPVGTRGPIIVNEFGAGGSRTALGLNGSLEGFLWDGTQGYVPGDNGAFLGSHDLLPFSYDSTRTFDHYIQLAWPNDNYVWDINQLRRGEELPGITTALSDAFVDTLVEDIEEQLSVDLVGTDPRIIDIQQDPAGSITDFLVTLEGDGGAHLFDLRFLDEASTEVGTVPVSIGGAYRQQLMAFDPDGDAPLTFEWAPGGQPAGATLDGSLLTYNPPAGLDLSQDVYFKLLVKDGKGGVGEQEWLLDVNELGAGNLAPQIDPIGSITLEVGQSFSYQVVATDDQDAGIEDNPLQYVLIDAEDSVPLGAPSDPTRLKIDEQSGIITWTPTLQDVTGDIDGHDIAVRVRDGLDGVTDELFEIKVLPPSYGNQAPEFVAVPTTELTPSLERVVSFTFTADDPDLDQLSFEIAGIEDDVIQTQGNKGIFNWNVEDVPLGSYSFVAIVRDGRGGSDFHPFIADVLAPNQPPVFATATQLPGAVQNAAYQATIFAFDPFDPTQPEESFLPVEPMSWAVVSGPSWLILTENGDGYSATLSGTPGVAGANQDVVIEVSDGDELTRKTFKLDVAADPGVNLAPTILTAPRTKIGVFQRLAYGIDVPDPENNPVTVQVSAVDGSGTPVPVYTPASPSPDGSGIHYDDDAQMVTWVPDADDLFSAQPFRLTVVADDGDKQDSKTFDLFVTGVTQENRPPEIIEELLPVAVAGEEYVLDLRAIAPDRDLLFWSLETSPDDSMTIHPRTGQIVWTPSEEHLGKQTATVRVVDSLSGLDELVLEIFVRGNDSVMGLQSSPPQLLPPIGFPATVEIGDTFSTEVFATDPDGGPLFFELSGAPEGMYLQRTSEASARVVWGVEASVATGSYTPTVTVSDRLGVQSTVPVALPITVVDSTDTPLVSLATSAELVLPGMPIELLVTVAAEHALCDIRLTASRDGMATFSIPLQRDFTAQGSFSEVGTYTVTAIVTTESGEQATSTLTIEVLDPATVKLPASVQITGLLDPEQITITGPLIDKATTVTFVVDNDPTVADESAIDYRLELLNPRTGELVQELASGTGEVLIPADVVGGVKAISPIALPNGGYIVRLTAINESGIPITDSRYVEIDTGQLKIGNFGLSFTDLEIPVVGLPISVTRSYDTTRANTASDFGFGWDLGITDASFAVDYNDGEGLVSRFREFQPGTRIAFTLPDGSVEQFSFTVVPRMDPNYNVAPPTVYYPQFNPIGRTTSELIYFSEPLGQIGNEYFSSRGGGYQPLSNGGVTLLLEDGTTLIFNTNSGKLAEVVDTDGNRTIFSGESIVNVTTGRGVIIERRDPNSDRITAVVDDNNKRIEYRYDELGNLAEVENREGEITKFYYGENGADQHFLTGIENNLGIRVLDPVFGPQGRLISLGTPGADIGFSYNVDLTTLGLTSTEASGRVLESVTDGNDIPTELVRDGSGNLERRLQLVDDGGDLANTANNTYLVTFYRYSEDSQGEGIQTHESTALEVLGLAQALVHGQGFEGDPAEPGFDPNQWRSVRIVDFEGRVTVSYDSLGNATFFEQYNRFGQPEVIIDPSGSVTANEYNDQGNLTGTTITTEDANGNEIILSKSTFEFANGRLSRTFDALNRQTGSFVYSDNGDLQQSTDAAGFTRNFITDDFGRVTDSSYVWDDAFADGIDLAPSGPITVATTTVYDDEGRVTESTDANGNLTVTAYDEVGRVKTVTRKSFTGLSGGAPQYDAFDEVTENFYNQEGLLVETRTTTRGTDDTLPTAIISRTAYDENGRPVYTTDPFLDGDTVTPGVETVYDDLGRTIQSIRYDDVDIPVSIDPAYATLRVVGTVATGAELYRDRTYYDNRGRVRYTLDGAGLINESVYNAADQLQQTIQYLSGAFDPADDAWKAAVPPEDKLVTTFGYDSLGRQETVTDANNHTTRSVYDSLGRVVQTVFHDGTVTESVYDDLGNLIAEIEQHDPLEAGLDKNAITTFYHYDVAGRLERVELPPVDDPAGGQSRPEYVYGYDIYGNQTSITDPNNHRTEFSYDHLNRQAARTLPEGVATPVGSAPNDYQERMYYDEAGRLERSVDFEGRTTDYVYDDLGRLDQKHYFNSEPAFEAGGGNPDGPDAIADLVDYVYDALGRQTEVVQDFDGDLSTTTDQRVTAYDYDEFGRVDEVVTDEGELNYIYNGLGQLQTTYTGADPASARTQTDYTYDILGRLETVTAAKVNGVADGSLTTYQYDPVGNLQEVIVQGGMSSFYEYDALNRLDLLTHYRDTDGTPGLSGSDTLVASFDYTLQPNGQRSGVTETVYDALGAVALTNTVAWVYDNANRLVEEYYDGEGTDYDFIDVYTYDLAGNRLQKQHDANPGFVSLGTISEPADLLAATPNFSNGPADDTVAYVYDDNDRLETETSTLNGVTSYVYNDAGEQTVKTDPSGTTNYRYDNRGRLVGIDADNNGVDETKYAYNDNGVRISQETPGGKTLYVVDANNPTGYAQVLEEVAAVGGALLRSYLLGNDVVAQWTAANGLLYLLYDGHGSTRGLVDPTGAPLTDQIYAYDAYGNQLDDAGSLLTPASAAIATLLYSGEQTDPTGMQYLRARYYNSAIGRFIRVDPFAGVNTDPQSLHKYLYTHANPTNAVDPSGLSIVSTISVAGLQGNLRGLNQGAQGAARVSAGRAIAQAAQRQVGLAINGLRQSPHLVRQYGLRIQKHIIGRHTPPLGTVANAGKSIFRTSNPRKIAKLVDRTMKSGQIAGNTGGRAGFIFTRTFDSPVGTNAAGQLVYTVKVVVSETGRLITAFPI